VSGWPEVRLGDIARIVNGRAYSKEELRDSGKYRVLRVGNFFSNRSWYWSDLELDEDKYCQRGDLLYAWSASFGPRIWEGEKTIFHYHIWNIKENNEVVDRRFLYWWLNWDVARIKAAAGTGSTMMHVTKGSMESRVLGLPPLDEQKRIVAKLDEATSSLKELIDLSDAKAQHSAVLVRALVARNLGKLSGRASKGTLGQFCDLYQPKTVSKKELKPDGKYVVFGANGPIGRYDDFNHEDSEVTMTCRGATCGTINVTPPYVWITGNAMVIRPKSDAVLKEFLACVLPYIDYSKAITGAAQPQITRQSLSPIPISIPTLEVQREVILGMSRIRSVHNMLETNLGKKQLALSSIHGTILFAAFSGEL